VADELIGGALGDLPFIEWTEPETGSLARIYADVVKDEAPNYPAIVTDHPVEQGSKIVDHYRKDPETFKIVMYFSGSPLRGDLDPDNPGSVNTFKLIKGQYPDGPPIFTPGGLTNAVGSAVGSLAKAIGFGGASPPTSWQALSFPTDPRKRFRKIVQLIKRLQTEGILVTVGASFDSIDNMAIMNAAPHRSAELGDGFELELDLKEVRFVTSELTLDAPIPLEPRAQPKKNTGSSGTKPIPPEDKSSVAYGMLPDSWK